MNKEIAKFWALCGYATCKARITDNIPDYEQDFVNILKHVKKYDNLRNEFVKCFLMFFDLYDDEEKSPPFMRLDIIAFCMRELKWQEILEFARKRNELNKYPREYGFLVNIIKAYEKEWRDDIMYEYYNK